MEACKMQRPEVVSCILHAAVRRANEWIFPASFRTDWFQETWNDCNRFGLELLSMIPKDPPKEETETKETP